MFRSSSLRHGLYVLQIALNSIIGYCFARMLAFQFGTTSQKDGFDIAYSVPFIVLNLGGFAFLHSVITMQFCRMRTANSPRINAVFSCTLTWMLSVGVLLLVLAFVFAGPLMGVLAPGLPDAVRGEATFLMLLLLPLALTLGVGTYIGAVLTAYEVPVTGEFCQLMSRLGVIVYAFSTGFRFDLNDVALGLVIASTIGVSIEWFVLRTVTGLRFRPIFRDVSPETRAIAKQGAGFIACAIAAQVAMSYMRRVATVDGVGTTAAITYAFAIIIPISLLVGKPLALIMGPRYVGLAAQKQWKQARALLVKAGAVSLAIGVSISVFMTFFASPVVRLLFGGGSFDADAVALTSGLCMYITWALPSALLQWVIIMPALATRNSSLPGILLTIGHVVHIVLTYLLFDSFGRFGLAFAYVAAMTFQMIVGVGFLYREIQLAIDATHRAGERRPQVVHASLVSTSHLRKAG